MVDQSNLKIFLLTETEQTITDDYFSLNFHLSVSFRSSQFYFRPTNAVIVLANNIPKSVAEVTVSTTATVFLANTNASPGSKSCGIPSWSKAELYMSRSWFRIAVCWCLLLFGLNLHIRSMTLGDVCMSWLTISVTLEAIPVGKFWSDVEWSTSNGAALVKDGDVWAATSTVTGGGVRGMGETAASTISTRERLVYIVGDGESLCTFLHAVAIIAKKPVSLINASAYHQPSNSAIADKPVWHAASQQTAKF